MKKTHIGALALVSAIGLGGCHYDQFAFKGHIGEEHVHSWTDGGRFSMQVTKPSGNKILYDDYNHDLKLDRVTITDDEGKKTYDKNVVGRGVLKEAQSDFYDYLSKIKAHQEERYRKI